MISSTENRKHLILFLIPVFLFFLISAVSADSADAEDLGTFKQNTLFDLKIACSNSTAHCPITTICNVTIVDPSSNTIISNFRMSNLSANYPYWNLTIVPSKSLVIGVYNGEKLCYESGGLLGSGISTVRTFTFEINPSGNNSTSENDNVLFYILLFSIAYGVTFFAAYGENIPLTLFGAIFLVILGLYSLNNGIVIYRNFATEAFSMVTLAVGAYFSITGGVKLINA